MNINFWVALVVPRLAWLHRWLRWFRSGMSFCWDTGALLQQGCKTTNVPSIDLHICPICRYSVCVLPYLRIQTKVCMTNVWHLKYIYILICLHIWYYIQIWHQNHICISYIHIYDTIYIHTCMRSCLHACMHACMLACVHACLPTYRHTVI